jgi:EAL domain-containing protein (putative c-di-GMP-specific phosphodiesterase class I)
MGIQIAIDDFGTGYSSLAYLSQLPVSKLKIDKIFVSAITKDKRCAAISRVVVTLAHNLGMRVIAEGVETVEQLDYLRDLGCDEMQGFLLARPLTVEDSVRFLKSAAKTPPLGKN